MCQQDQIFVRKNGCLDDAVKQGAYQRAVIKTGLLHAIEKILLSAGFFLCQGKLQIKEIPADLAAQCLAEDLTVFFDRRFFQSKEGFLQLRDDLTVFIYIASPDLVDPAIVHSHQFADFRNCFLVQKRLPLAS